MKEVKSMERNLKKKLPKSVKPQITYRRNEGKVIISNKISNYQRP